MAQHILIPHVASRQAVQRSLCSRCTHTSACRRPAQCALWQRPTGAQACLRRRLSRPRQRFWMDESNAQASKLPASKVVHQQALVRVGLVPPTRCPCKTFELKSNTYTAPELHRSCRGLCIVGAWTSLPADAATIKCHTECLMESYPRPQPGTEAWKQLNRRPAALTGLER